MKICRLSTQTLFKLFGPSLPFQQVAGNAILFNAEMKFAISANKKVGQNGQEDKTNYNCGTTHFDFLSVVMSSI